MDELTRILKEKLNKDFVSAVLSNPRDKGQASKAKVRPVRQKGRLMFQIEMFRNNQAFHENLDADRASDRLAEYMENFRQMQLESGTSSLSSGRIFYRRLLSA